MIDFFLGYLIGLFLGLFFGTVLYVWYVIAKLETHEAYLDGGRLVWRERK